MSLILVVAENSGAPGTTLKCDLLIRSQTLYPTELRVQERSKGSLKFQTISFKFQVSGFKLLITHYRTASGSERDKASTLPNRKLFVLRALPRNSSLYPTRYRSRFRIQAPSHVPRALQTQLETAHQRAKYPGLVLAIRSPRATSTRIVRHLPSRCSGLGGWYAMLYNVRRLAATSAYKPAS